MAKTSNNPLLEVVNLCKTFKNSPKPALDSVNLEIFPGKMVGLVGPDGAGKTTFIRLITGLMLANSGTICVFGYDSRFEAEKIHPYMGYMPQKFGLYEDLTVIENLDLYADLRNVLGEQRNQKFKQLLDFTSLNNFQQRLAGKLSGGMKQKLGLACALLGSPRLLVLDEPSVGVDPISRRELWQMVKGLISEGMAVLWSTAYLDEAERCDSVLLLNEGVSLYSGAPYNLLERLKGRSWHLENIEEKQRRAVLMEVLKDKHCMDGLIQGKNIRILTTEKKILPSLPDNMDASHWQAVAPCFEDAFMDKLGGGPGGVSALANAVPEKAPYSEAVIKAEHLCKRFGNFTAVSDNSFSIHRGEIFGLLGPNGAGKSTTFKMLCGLLQPSSGSASIMGYDLRKSSSKARARLGYMAQKFSLYGHLNVAQNLQFFSGVYGLSGKAQRTQIDAMIDIFELQHYLHKNAAELPLGYKQRLALACAVMHDPDILFLDEPTSGVDPVTRREFWLHINGLVAKGVTIMVTTHFMDEAEYCDKIALIYNGENIAKGTPDYLKSLAVTKQRPEPSLEDAFIALVQSKKSPSQLDATP